MTKATLSALAAARYYAAIAIAQIDNTKKKGSSRSIVFDD
jgi:hypothetical protein